MYIYFVRVLLQKNNYRIWKFVVTVVKIIHLQKQKYKKRTIYEIVNLYISVYIIKMQGR